MNTCPQCDQLLQPFLYHEIELLICETCHGAWFQEGTFRDVKHVGFAGLARDVGGAAETPPAEAAESSPEVHLFCPECEVELIPFSYAYSSDIELHRCTRCRGIWAEAEDLLRIERLLAGYQESLEEAKAKAMPLMLNVKKQIQQEEKKRQEEQKRKNPGLFNRLFGRKRAKNRKVQNIFEEYEEHEGQDEDDDTEEEEQSLRGL